MQIASWNVNSIRARLDHVYDWLRSAEPDVLCLQETKVVDSEFPTDTFARLGYETVRVGQKSYNGVALISREPVTDVLIGHSDGEERDEARLISGTVRGVRILSAYVPNGKTLESPSFAEKLAWLGRLKKTLADTAPPGQAVVLGGDFNIARDARDVFDEDLMRDKIHFSAAEHDALEELLKHGLTDTFRVFEKEGSHFSWWDYRMGAFRRNRGFRIDYLFASAPVIERLTQAGIDRQTRSWDKPSDHAPVFIHFDWP